MVSTSNEYSVKKKKVSDLVDVAAAAAAAAAVIHVVCCMWRY